MITPPRDREFLALQLSSSQGPDFKTRLLGGRSDSSRLPKLRGHLGRRKREGEKDRYGEGDRHRAGSSGSEGEDILHNATSARKAYTARKVWYLIRFL